MFTDPFHLGVSDAFAPSLIAPLTPFLGVNCTLGANCLDTGTITALTDNTRAFEASSVGKQLREEQGGDTGVLKSQTDALGL